MFSQLLKNIKQFDGNWKEAEDRALYKRNRFITILSFSVDLSSTVFADSKFILKVNLGFMVSEKIQDIYAYRIFCSSLF